MTGLFFYIPRPFNSPASWETNPYGDMFRN